MTTIHNWLQDYIDVTDEELVAIHEIIETTQLRANEIILKQGQISTRIGLIVQGAIRSYFTDNKGNDKTLSFSFEGEPIAAIDSFLNQKPSSITTITLEPSTIIWTDYVRYSSFVKKFPKYNTLLLAALARWFAEGKNRMEYLHQSSAKDKYDTMCKLHPKIIKRVPLMYIASYLGITQSTLSRIRIKK